MKRFRFRTQGGWFMWGIVIVGLLLVAGGTWFAMRRFGEKEGIQLASTLVGTISTVVLGAFAWQQLHAAQTAEQLMRSAKWGELRNCMWEIMDQFPPQGTEALKALTPEQRAVWFRTIRRLLDSEIDNPVLLADAQSIGHWRNAISAAKTGADVIATAANVVKDETFKAWADGILSDVMKVWERLVLDSDEVSPTGGRPKE